MAQDILRAVPARSKLVFNTDNEIFATLSFFPPAVQTDTDRAPLNIVAAIDVSGSMEWGGKIDAVKRSLLKLVEHLTDRDRLGIVAFANHATTVCEPLLLTTENKRLLQERVNQMQAGGGTNLSGGLLQALDYLKNADVDKGTVQRCMIFTDGQANIGIRDSDQLASTVAEYRGSIAISAFGYGKDHDGVLLDSISQDGDFYFIDTPDKILSAFGTELGGLISCYAQNIRLTLQPGEGVKIIEILNDLNVTAEEGETRIECDDLMSEQEYHVVVRLKLDPRQNAHPRDTTLLKANARLFDVAAKDNATLQTSLKVRFVKAGEEETVDNPAVMNEVALQRSIQAQNKAMLYAEQGDFAGARDLLLASSRYCQSVGANSLAAVSLGLANDNYIDADRYRMGGASESRAIRKAMTRRKGGASLTKGGVDVGAMYANTSQAATRALFEGQDSNAEVIAQKPRTMEESAHDAILRKCTNPADVNKSPAKKRSDTGGW